MTLEFIKQINEYVIEATEGASDEEILATIGKSNYPSWDDIRNTQSIIEHVLTDWRRHKLTQKKAEFQAYKRERKNTLDNWSLKRSISKMLLDIVTAMQNKDKVPEGILLAFREQGQEGSDDDIKKIWQSLVELGLIDPKNNDL